MANDESRDRFEASDSSRGGDSGYRGSGSGGRDSDDGGSSSGRSRGDRRGGRSSYRGGRSRPFFRKKVCRFCKQNFYADYKNPDSLRRFVTDRGKILPRRITGTCAKHQRELAVAVKRSRALALLPYAKR